MCSAIKQDSALRTIPVILLSTLADAQDIIKGLHCGADNYVTKPYDPEFLIARVASLLETPIDQDDQDQQQLDVTLGGNQYTVRAGRQQVLNLLVSTFENAVEKNQELVRINEELTVAKEQLTRWKRRVGVVEQPARVGQRADVTRPRCSGESAAVAVANGESRNGPSELCVAIPAV